jgi:hypothetical protein
MTDPNNAVNAETLAFNQKLADIDNELARLAAICQVQLLDRDKIERVLKNDTSVCGVQSPQAFTKMRELLMMHYAVRKQASEQIGEVETRAIINSVIERLEKRLGMHR